MRRKTFSCLAVLALLGQAAPGPGARAQDDPLDAQRRAEADPRLLLVKIQGSLEKSSAAAMVDAIERAVSSDPLLRYVVFELDSSGGELEAALTLKQLIVDRLKSLTTIAFVPDGGDVSGEALLLALGVRHLFLGRDSHLGADLERSQAAEAEKKLLAPLRQVAKERGHPQYLVDAMATGDHPDVYFVIEKKTPQSADEKRFYSKADLEDRKRAGQRPAGSSEPELVVSAGKKLRLGAEDAVRFGLARSGGELDTVREAHGLTLPDENIILLGQGPLRAASPGAQKVIDFLNHSLVRFVILLLACLAALIEVKTAGSFVAGLLSLVLFGVFFLAASFPTTGQLHGTASPWEISLFLLGVGLLAVEFLLLPGMGIFAISGAAVCGISLVLAMVPASSSQLTGGGTMTEAVIDSLAILAYGFGAGGVFFVVILKFVSRHGGLASRGLVTTTTITGVATAESALAAQAGEVLLINQEGTAATLLRPAGKVELADGRILDVVTEGELLEKGARVKVVSSSGGIIKVARAENSERK